MPPNTELQTQPASIRRVSDANCPEFESLLGIYIDSIVESERKSIARLTADFERSEYFFLVLVLADEIIGFSIVFVPENHEFALLEYMAIVKDHRNKGHGNELFQ